MFLFITNKATRQGWNVVMKTWKEATVLLPTQQTKAQAPLSVWTEDKLGVFYDTNIFSFNSVRNMKEIQDIVNKLAGYGFHRMAKELKLKQDYK